MRMSIYFAGGSAFETCSIDAFIIADKPVPHHPELGCITYPLHQNSVRLYY